MGVLSLPALNETVLASVLLPALYSSTCLAHVLAYLAFETALSTECCLSDNSMSTIIDVSLIIPIWSLSQMAFFLQALIPIASMQPDPTIRHISFRILSSLIDKLHDEAFKLRILVELISSSPFPQMQATAVTLLRSTILFSLAKATSPPHASISLFSTPQVLNTISKVLFCLEPPNIFEKYASSHALNEDNVEATRKFVKEFSESPQTARIAEALNFYYILLSRDQMNMVSKLPAVLGQNSHSIGRLAFDLRVI